MASAPHPKCEGETLDLSKTGDLIRRGGEYWLSLKRDREMPSRADFDPLDIPTMLPNIVMMDVLDDPIDYAERVVGQTVLYHSTENYTGIPWRTLDKRQPDSRIWQAMDTVRRERKMFLDNIPYVGPHQDFLRIEVLSCPLSNATGKVIKILCFVEFFEKGPYTPEEFAIPFNPV